MSYLFALVAYLIGSVPMAIVVARALSLPDPRTQGSGNPGTTNVLRYGGKKAAVLTLVGDVLKGVIAVAIVCAISVDPWAIALSGLAVFLGHLYPIFFGFRGGKGVATALGVWLVLIPAVGVALLVTWIITAAAFRYSSFAALIAAVAAPLYVWSFEPVMEYVFVSLAMSALLIWRHRGNIVNLLAGKESQIQFSRRSAPNP